ncbi:MAG: isoprenyl transferase [Thermodesulfobacteriota bacterium]|nr:isoprenyl transferase [Thermodesulfobacteriota bacterium]
MNSSKPSLIRLDLDMAKLPSHIAIIMDGNGRWAKKRLMNRINGHEKGVETVRTIVRASREIGIPHLTLYAFSTENWHRPKNEVDALMALLLKFLKSEKKEMIDENIRLNAIGQIERLNEDVRKQLDKIMALTKKNSGMQLNLALSYGGRWEIVQMVRRIALKVKQGHIDTDLITPETISKHLCTDSIPDPDLLIRTSGEMRISNFLLWQIAYTEIYVTDTLWPDFTEDEFVSIIKNYQNRERRFGGLEA